MNKYNATDVNYMALKNALDGQSTPEWIAHIYLGLRYEGLFIFTQIWKALRSGSRSVFFVCHTGVTKPAYDKREVRR
ncbi:hypothetical protein M3650_18130 [Paenibacillus sp. MER TA 81-3]|uniref:hypothetical protein n=1 Tax=Paenibacillus sp. MER TA 81-3 TaxID=2939573 RepID=UPI00203FAB65|nr:hypothetical protein [Paenibacillus sp. MER TA 81-3]MCM3340506.1 hypothetical protein [Paenibacillus sp. MER TA 81-3]